MIVALLGCHGAATARPTEGDPLEGRWEITWVRPEGWWPKEFTGTLDAHETNAGWVATVWFDQTEGPFTFESAVVEGSTAVLGWTVGDTTFQMKVAVDGKE